MIKLIVDNLNGPAKMLPKKNLNSGRLVLWLKDKILHSLARFIVGDKGEFTKRGQFYPFLNICKNNHSFEILLSNLFK
jgi:hypothetical protein